MKIDLTAAVKSPQGIELTEGGKPVTLGQLLRMAVASDPVWEHGQQAGSPRPLGAGEITDRVALLNKLDADEIELTASEAAKAQDIVRVGLRAAFAVAVSAMLNGDG